MGHARANDICHSHCLQISLLQSPGHEMYPSYLSVWIALVMAVHIHSILILAQFGFPLGDLLMRLSIVLDRLFGIVAIERIQWWLLLRAIRLLMVKENFTNLVFWKFKKSEGEKNKFCAAKVNLLRFSLMGGLCVFNVQPSSIVKLYTPNWPRLVASTLQKAVLNKRKRNLKMWS